MSYAMHGIDAAIDIPPLPYSSKSRALFAQIPVSHGEGLQVLHYQAGEKYEPHWDYFQDQVNQVNGGQRVATMLMYLTDVEEGGETVFPNSLEKPVCQQCACYCAG